MNDHRLVLTAKDAENLVRRYIDEVWNNGNYAVLEELTSPSFTYRLGGQAPRERTAFVQFLEMTRQAFPDWRVEIDQAIAQPTAVAARWHGQVTHRGAFRGIPPTGRVITVAGINIYAIEDGKIAAEWEQMDTLGMLQQLGVLPG